VRVGTCSIRVVDAVAFDGRELIRVNTYTPVISDKDGLIMPNAFDGLDSISTGVNLEDLDAAMLMVNDHQRFPDGLYQEGKAMSKHRDMIT
jgi:hypothetical protein